MNHAASVRHFIRWMLLAFVLAAQAAGCSRSIESTNNAASLRVDEAGIPKVLRSHTVRAPVQFTVEVVPEKPRLSDELKMTLTVRVEAGVRVITPPFGSSLGDFLIRDFYEPLKKLDGTTEVQQQVYTLEPMRAGKLTIDPLTVTFYDERQDGDKQPRMIESEPLEVEVTTMLAEKSPSLADLRPNVEPMALPSSGPGRMAWAVGALLAMLLALMVFLGLRKRVTIVEQTKTPQELAWNELDRLVTSNLGKVDPKQYYVELTGVVRRFIERSTGVRAPEQTTEEFLREITTSNQYSENEQRSLQEFLESADLVKFAGLQPRAEDIDSSLQRAQTFIGASDRKLHHEVTL